MGTDCAPFLAKLLLYSFEFEFMEKMSNDKNSDIYKLKHVARYLDDMILFDNDDVFEKYKDSIYPKELILKCENDDEKEASFLDLYLTVKNDKFVYKIYDKRDDFPFEIVNYPNLTGNICAINAMGSVNTRTAVQDS